MLDSPGFFLLFAGGLPTQTSLVGKQLWTIAFVASPILGPYLVGKTILESAPHHNLLTISSQVADQQIGKERYCHLPPPGVPISEVAKDEHLGLEPKSLRPVVGPYGHLRTSQYPWDFNFKGFKWHDEPMYN